MLKVAAALSIAVAVGVCATVRPDRLIAMASGAVSQNLCTGTFVSGLAPDAIYAEEMRPEGGMGLIDWALRYRVDRAERRVTTTVFGLFATTSAFHDGYGCRLEHPRAAPFARIAADADGERAALPDIAGREPVAAGDPALARALDAAFASEEGGRPRSTRAIVVVHRGRVVAERYAKGIGVDTPLLSHSIAKSVTNALVGVLVRDGALRVDQQVSAPAWRSPVTVDQLLRMSSGLPLDEGRGPGLAQRMWFVESDDAGFAERTPLVAEPGAQWRYSNLGYAVLSRLVRDAAGGTPAQAAAFANRALFGPLGMRSATVEFDGAGSPMGAPSNSTVALRIPSGPKSARFANAAAWAGVPPAASRTRRERTA